MSNDGEYEVVLSEGQEIIFQKRTSSKAVAFGSTGANSFSARVAVTAEYAGQDAQVRLGSTSGTLVGTLSPQATGGWDIYQTQSTSISQVTGTHDLYIVFVGANGIGNFDWFVFSNGTAAPTATPSIRGSGTQRESGYS